MATSVLGIIFGIPGWLWYTILVVLLIVVIVLYSKYRKQMS